MIDKLLLTANPLYRNGWQKPHIIWSGHRGLVV